VVTKVENRLQPFVYPQLELMVLRRDVWRLLHTSDTSAGGVVGPVNPIEQAVYLQRDCGLWPAACGLRPVACGHAGADSNGALGRPQQRLPHFGRDAVPVDPARVGPGRYGMQLHVRRRYCGGGPAGAATTNAG
jgi:hypothetical protein